MSFRLSSLGCCVTLCFLGGISLVSTSAYAQGESRPRRALELSETNNPEVLTRLNQLTDKKEGLKELQGEWNKSLESMSLETRVNGGAGQPLYAPPRPPPISSKRMKDLLERKRNWMLTPEDLTPETSGQDWLNDSGGEPGRKDRNKSSLKQFSDGLDRSESGKSKLGSGKLDDESDFLKSANLPSENTFQDDPSLPAGIRTSAKNLRNWLESEPAQSAVNPGEARSSFEDFFSVGIGGLDRQQEKAQKSYLEKYQTEVLGGSILSPSVSTVNPLMNALAPANSPLRPVYAGGLESAASGLKQDTSVQTAGTLGSVQSPVAVPDLNARALNQWNPLYGPTKPDLPRTVPSALPSMDFPRRRF